MRAWWPDGLAFVGKVVAGTLRRHPEINCALQVGRLYPRQTVDLFVQVAADPIGKDLSGTTIRRAQAKSIEEIAVSCKPSTHPVPRTSRV